MEKLRSDYIIRHAGGLTICTDGIYEVFTVQVDNETVDVDSIAVYCDIPEVGESTPIVITKAPRKKQHTIIGYKLRNGYELIIDDVCHVNVVTSVKDKCYRTTVTVNHEELGKYTLSFLCHNYAEDDTYTIEYSGRIIDYVAYVSMAKCLNEVAIAVQKYNPGIFIEKVK